MQLIIPQWEKSLRVCYNAFVIATFWYWWYMYIFVCKDSRRTSSVSTMITKLGWKPPENRRAISRLSLLFKSIHHTVAINTDKHLTSQADNKICTRKSCEISFTHPTVKKDCYKHSFLPRTMTEWNLLPPNIRQSTSVDSLKSKLNNMDLTSFIRGAHY